MEKRRQEQQSHSIKRTDPITQKAPDISSLRREKIRARKALSPKERAQKSAEICRRLQESAEWKKSGTVLVYVSYGEEVSTRELIEQAFLDGKRVYCPRVCGKGRMEFYRILSADDLQPGFCGIPEPSGDGERFPAGVLQPYDILILVPGTVFDRCGHRIGYGGGYYDRYLARFPKGNRPCCIGLCFGCQMTESLVPKEHDIPVDRVIYI